MVDLHGMCHLHGWLMFMPGSSKCCPILVGDHQLVLNDDSNLETAWTYKEKWNTTKH